MHPIFAILEGLLQPSHLFVILIIGLLFYGKRLPELGRSLGKGLVEFKKGLSGVEDDLEHGTSSAPRPSEAVQPAVQPPPRVVPKTPRFEETSNTGNPGAPSA